MAGNTLDFENSGVVRAKIFSTGYVLGTGRLICQGATTVGGVLRLMDADSSHSLDLVAPTVLSSNLAFTLPDADGSSGQFLQTDGSGVLSFASASGGGDNISNANLTATGSYIYDINGETQEIDVNGGEFEITDLSHTYLEANSNSLALVGNTLTLNSLVFPSSDGTANQVLQTNGSGTLSFTDLPIIVLANISGRYLWASSDDAERVWTGSTAYGPFNWYNHTSEPSSADVTLRDYSGSEVVGTTTETIQSY